MTLAECNTALAELRAELDQQVVLMLTASFESLFQLDRIERFERKKKGPLSRSLRKWWKGERRNPQKWLKMESLLDA